MLTEDGGIVRRIKVKGEGYNNPNDGATVHGNSEFYIFKMHCCYSGCLLDKIFVWTTTWFCLCSSVHLEGWCGGSLFESRDVTFVVGESVDAGVPLGVDRSMEKMQKGECCLLYLKPK